jgi:dTDP-4-dehydrorhamnose reductase
MEKQRILITGGTGLLGKSLVQKFKYKHEIAATYVGDYDVRSSDHTVFVKVDVRDYGGNRAVFEKYRPHVIIHTASVGSPDFAEKNKELTWQINVEGTKTILSLCEMYNSKFVYISSNGIYDGEHAPYGENDIPHPINYYGMVKLEGEKVTRMSRTTFSIVRPILLYGWNHPFERPNIVTMALDKLSKGETMMAYDDVIVNPLYVEDCSEGILRIIENDRYETFNFAGKDRTSIYGLLKKAAEVFNHDPASVLPVKQGYFNELVPRPKDTSYVTDKMEQELALKPSGIEEGLILMKRQCRDEE